MNMYIKYCLLATLLLVIVLVVSCRKPEETPTYITELTTVPIANLSVTSITAGGTIVTEGGDEIIRRGVCWDTIPNPVITDSHLDDGKKESGNFVMDVSGLRPGTKYFIRAFVVVMNDTVYGNEQTFNTKIADKQGNLYNTVTIGSQVWMAENLRVTRYNNGDSILTTSADFFEEIDPKYQWVQNNDELNAATYGRLYTWFIVEDNRGVCPAGWHVPVMSEFDTLKAYLGGENLAGSKLKEAGTDHWNSPNTGANNESGFNALGGGYVTIHGAFVSLGVTTYFWSSEEDTYNDNTWGMGYGLYYNNKQFVWGGYYRATGKSIRCIRDY